jgi:beta-glucosidase
LIRRTAAALPQTDIHVTENGAAYGDGPDGSGRIKDAARIAYLDAHLAAVAQACNEALPVKGYFAWSLLDNFEWAKGYSERFGLVWVNFAQRQTRVIKESGLWYARLARSKYLT